MTVSEFETLRSEIAAMRADVAGLRIDMDGRFTEMDGRLIKVEAKLDEKPGAATVYQVAFGAPIALVGFSAALVALAKALGLI
ncbi:hypothetical protein [Hansschlegelia zhihuaiae]|uniref:Uncharacterized protein n=1 Tax=Hansschlegelia zhihuaiae TaxID=405005 RepID=A0A4Q0MJ43_9HYPH|nr:hypothetical protein [Hansschlegelia zhihuaiae]RXF73558.1 hypothetical protein EK403_10230 [Hansschlegelia zhihuaiae]